MDSYLTLEDYLTKEVDPCCEDILKSEKNILAAQRAFSRLAYASIRAWFIKKGFTKADEIVAKKYLGDLPKVFRVAG